MSEIGNRSLAVQSITQVSVRGLRYLAILLVLPSFIFITDARTYADIVLVSTLVSLAALFDGGHAVSVLTLLSSPAMQKSESRFRSAVMQALKGSAMWSLIISITFVSTWMMLSPTQETISNIYFLILACVVLSIITTLANTFGRILLTKEFTKLTVFILLGGPSVSLIILLIIRYFGDSNPLWIILSFSVGGLFVILGCAYKFSQLTFEFDVGSEILSRVEHIEYKEHKSHRLWLFMSQVISIAVVSKTPILIRLLCGNEALGLFSLFSAANAIIVAPVAAMQAPLLVRYAKLLSAVDIKLNFIKKTILRHIAVAILLGLLGGGLLMMLVGVAHQFVNKDISQLSYKNLSIIAVSASIYIGSVIVAIFLNAIGQARLIVKMAMVVLVLDTIFIFILAGNFGALTPILTMPVANIFAFLLLISSTKYILNVHR